MPFFNNSPEALLRRSDSKNPATTCKGLTSGGRPCRRDISSSVKPNPKHGPGVLAVVPINEAEGAAAYFCWQHKDQANSLVQETGGQSNGGQDETHIVPLQQRSSIDTLVAKLGVLEMKDEAGKPAKPKKRKSNQVPEPKPQQIQRPPTWGKVHGPVMSVPMNAGAQFTRPSSQRPQKQRDFLGGLCCTLCCGDDDDDYVEIVRHKKRTQGQQQQQQMAQTAPMPPQARPSKPAAVAAPSRPKPTDPASQTAHLLTFIPPSVSPATASIIMAEATKTISDKDEPGYIYIFWLTESSDENKLEGPSERDASSLLAPPEPSRPAAGRRTSDVLRQHSIRAGTAGRPGEGSTRSRGGPAADEPRRVLLKIGRANNVYRRMNEWTRQCGYRPTLLRFYPYMPSSTPSPSPGPSARVSPSRHGSDESTASMVPYVHKVERLIHLELAEQRVLRECGMCGKVHKEWFEVEASRDGVRSVDDTVRRWVRWAQETEAAGGPKLT